MWLWIVCVCVVFSWTGSACSNTNYQMKTPHTNSCINEHDECANWLRNQTALFHISLYFALILTLGTMQTMSNDSGYQQQQTRKNTTQQPLLSTWNTLLMNLKYLITQSHNASTVECADVPMLKLIFVS